MKNSKIVSAIALAVGLCLASTTMASPCEYVKNWEVVHAGKHTKYFHCEGYSNLYQCKTFKMKLHSGKVLYFANLKKLKEHGKVVHGLASKSLRIKDLSTRKIEACTLVYKAGI